MAVAVNQVIQAGPGDAALFFLRGQQVSQLPALMNLGFFARWVW